MLWRLLISIGILSLLVSCEKIALVTTPKKKANIDHTKLAKQAEQTFWTALLAGNYDNIPLATKLLMAAYLENPNDPRLAAHLGFLHIWKITERKRATSIPPTIVDEIILAKKYFGDAVLLNPNDARLLGFYGDSTLITGSIFADAREEVHGYFILKEAMNKWPEFNYFTAGYPMSSKDWQSWQFKEGLAWQWQTLTLCAGQKITKDNPNFAPYMHLQTLQGFKRACWNTWIAPHNFEGFFLNMGDMLVKSGDWPTAIKIYQNAKLSKTYAAWPYRFLLEKRIREAQENVQQFRKPAKLASTPILFDSGYGCAVCHQQSGSQPQLRH